MLHQFWTKCWDNVIILGKVELILGWYKKVLGKLVNILG